jgi:hypothetical protein
MATESIVQRMIRAARLDTTFYNEVEQDTSLNGEALTVVILAAVASGIGAAGSTLIAGNGAGTAAVALVVGAIVAVVGYFVWAWLTQFIGTRFFGGVGDFGETRRTLGYAYAPNLLGIFNLIPCLGALIALVGSLWALVAGVIAVREALDVDTTKAVLTVVVSWLIVFVISAVILSIVGVGALGLAAVTGALNQ